MLDLCFSDAKLSSNRAFTAHICSKSRGGIFIKIAICISENKLSESIYETICEYGEKRRLQIFCRCFKIRDDILSFADEYDIFIFDCRKNQTDGLKKAQSIKNIYKKQKAFIFVSDTIASACKTFEVDALTSLTVPINAETLCRAIDNYIFKSRFCGNLAIRLKKELDFVPADKIYYIEAAKRSTSIHTQAKELYSLFSISYYEKELADLSFFRIHRSYLININMLKSFNGKYVTFINGEKLIISPKKYPALCCAVGSSFIL